MIPVDKLTQDNISKSNLGENFELESNQSSEFAALSFKKKKKGVELDKSSDFVVTEIDKLSEDKKVEKKLNALEQFNEDIYNIIVDDDLLDHLVDLDKTHALSIHKFKLSFLQFIEKEFYENQQDKKLDQQGMTELLLKEF